MKQLLLQRFKVFLSFIFSLMLGSSASATVFNVNTTTDSHAVSPGAGTGIDNTGHISFRSALEAADAVGGTHTVNLPAGTYNLSLGEISIGDITVNVTIVGASAATTIVSMTATNQDRILFIDPPGTVINVIVSVSNITFSGGKLNSDPYGGGAICGGGIGNSLTVSNCIFQNNSIPTGNSSGGAIAFTYGGTLSINNCTFTNNTTADGAGGGVFYSFYSSGSSFPPTNSISITNSTFTNNSTTVASGSGGALGINIAGNPGGATFSGSILRNTFSGNTANASNGQGGAIEIVNSFAVGNTIQVNYNRFVNNSSALAPNGLVMAVNQGAVNANDNWWGCNTGPNVAGACNRAALTTGAAFPGLTTWLQLKASASPASICSNATSTVTAGFLSNSAGTAISTANLAALVGVPVSFVSPVLGSLSGAQATIQASGNATVTFTGNGTAGSASVNAVVDNVPGNDATAKVSFTTIVSPSISLNPSAGTSCLGLPVSFTAGASNQTSVAWQESVDAGFSAPATLTNTGIYSGATSTTLTIADNTTVNGKYYRLVAANSNGCSSANSTGALLTATTPSLSANNTVTQTVNTSNNLYYAASCGGISKIVPSGGSPVTGSVTTQVWVEGAVPTQSGKPFVQRHYQVTPGTAPSTATATITLYFSQAEFDNFNAAAGSTLKLPTGPGDAAGKANLRIAKYSGSSSGGGLPASYSSGAIIIDPVDANIVYNGTPVNRWEVTFDVAGFSGFIVQTNLFVLPIKLLSFNAQLNNITAVIKWQIAMPEEAAVYTLQRSTTGSNFTAINRQQGDISKTLFNYTDPLPGNGSYYYRLQMTDKDGKITYSNIVFLRSGNREQEVTVYPSPVKRGESIQVSVQNIFANKIEVIAVSGKVIYRDQTNRSGNFTIPLPVSITQGMYLIKIFSDQNIITKKIMVQ